MSTNAQVALAAAAQAFTGANPHWGDNVIRIADAFLKWLEEQDNPEA